MTWNFTWENGRQLVSATTSGSTYTYTYTADGTRTGKTVGDTEHVYYYADGKLRREQRDGTNIDFFYDASGAPYAFRHQGNYYYVTKADLSCEDLLARLQKIWNEQETHRQAVKAQWNKTDN